MGVQKYLMENKVFILIRRYPKVLLNVIAIFLSFYQFDSFFHKLKSI